MRKTRADDSTLINRLVKSIVVGGADAKKAFEHYKLLRRDKSKFQLSIEAEFLNVLAAQPDLSCCDHDVLMEATRIYSRNDHFKEPDAFLTHLETSANQPWSHLHSAYLSLPRKLQRYKLLKQIFDQLKQIFDQSIVGGDAVSQNNLGMAYFSGLGVVKDYEKAFTCYQGSAQQKFAEAQYNLGCMYFEGQGFESQDVAKDYEKAVECISKAAEQGLAAALCSLGVMYEMGQGVTQDDAKAVECYEESAEQGYPPAQCNLGSMYLKGQGVPENHIEAVTWYHRAAQQGHARAQYNMGLMCEKARGVGENNAEAVMWYQLLAGQGHILAEAVMWYQLSAGQGYIPAQFNLGVMYETGEGISAERQPDKEMLAAFWFEKAAKQGNGPAKEKLKNLKLTKRQQKIKTLMLERDLSYEQASQFIDNSGLRHAILLDLDEIRSDDKSLPLSVELSLLIFSKLSSLSEKERFDLNDKTTGFFLYKHRAMRVIESFLANQTISSFTFEYKQAESLLTQIRGTASKEKLFTVLEKYLENPAPKPSKSELLWIKAGGFNRVDLDFQLEGVCMALQELLDIHILYKNRAIRVIKSFLTNQKTSSLTSEYKQAKGLLTQLHGTGSKEELITVLKKKFSEAGGFNRVGLDSQLESVYKALQKLLDMHILYRHRAMRVIKNFLTNKKVSSSTSEYKQAKSLLTPLRDTESKEELITVLKEYLENPDPKSSEASSFNRVELNSQLKSVCKALQELLDMDTDLCESGTRTLAA